MKDKCYTTFDCIIGQQILLLYYVVNSFIMDKSFLIGRYSTTHFPHVHLSVSPGELRKRKNLKKSDVMKMRDSERRSGKENP